MNAEAQGRSRLATIRAEPHAVSLDIATCAVLVVDMQNDFGAEGGMFHRAGIGARQCQVRDRSRALHRIAERSRELAAALRGSFGLAVSRPLPRRRLLDLMRRYPDG